MDYNEFLKNKIFKMEKSGFDINDSEVPNILYPFQKAIVKWALKRGKAAIFADTGLGKTFMQVVWGYHVQKQTNKQILIVAPLCVAEQTVNEAKKLNINVSYLREYIKEEKIIITNYEMLDKFIDAINAGNFSGIVLDESSILKHEDSKTRRKIIELSQNIPYRLSCTATPSPNDYMELGSQAEFLGLMSSVEMLSMFFIHDAGETQKWRLKGHGKTKFWEWMATWCIYIKKPSDIGFDDTGYALPELNIEQVNIGDFVIYQDASLQGRHAAKKQTVQDRVSKTAMIVNNSKESFIVWCQRNDESSELAKLIPDSVEVSGSDDIDSKHDKIMRFTRGEVRVLITKPKIAGFGMNWQHCHNIVFAGLSDSYEQVYQAIRRCWRYGQENKVNVFSIAHAREFAVLVNIKRKEKQAYEMSRQMVIHMREFQNKAVNNLESEEYQYETKEVKDQDYKMVLGDCIEKIKEIESDSIGYSIFSPPFASLYTYSNSERDMGNNKTYNDFCIHFGFLIKELYRVMIPGRLVSVHCMNLPTSKQRDGYIGINDFRGDIIRSFAKEGFIYQSEVVIWKDPVVAMQRTKALGLLWKQIQKDSAMCRQGIPDYVLTFRKKGENPNPLNHSKEDFPVEKWQKYASPVWMDIRQYNTLNGRLARADDDERHICPLQLDVIYRCIDLWSKKGDIVLSPFAGIGSEGYVALQLGRKFHGIELKKSYFNYAVQNLDMATRMPKPDLKDGLFTPSIKIRPGAYNNHSLMDF